MPLRKTKPKKPKADSVLGWNTTDTDERMRRRVRGETEKFQVENKEPSWQFYSSFLVTAQHGAGYIVEIRSLSSPINSCSCPDYRHNRLGTCKHIEHVLFRLRKMRVSAFKDADKLGTPRVEIFLDPSTQVVQIMWTSKVKPSLHQWLDPFFSTQGNLLGNQLAAYPKLLESIANQDKSLCKLVRISQHIGPVIDYQKRKASKERQKELFLKDIAKGKRTLDIVKHPLYKYQEEGLLHLAFNERALLADEMGLGKTVQAIAACELLRRLKNIERILIIATASLKAEWEEQINKFTGLSTVVIQGSRAERLKLYQQPAFFYITNYEQVVIDHKEIQHLLMPEVIILDEAQRIKNWQTKTAHAIKQLSSPYAFVLTGTPLENRIDDIYSIIQFLDPYIFGSLFQFNRDFYELDDKGKPIGYKNLDELHRRLRPVMLRRQKNEVEGELPPRTINNYFVQMAEEQRLRYDEYQDKVARLLARAQKRSLLKEEFEKLQRWLSCMRMLCDSPYILDQNCKISPKLSELQTILNELLTEPETKIIIFSEWERMLQLIREWAENANLHFAWHTGSTPQKKRREEINRFKHEAGCRLFLSTDAGSVGLNLQRANVVINVDLPWNPAKWEQRIARAWRKHQTRSVQVINLVCEDSIEHRMLDLLAQKQALAQQVIDGSGAMTHMALPSGRVAFMERMQTLLNTQPATTVQPLPPYQMLIKHFHSQLDLLQYHDNPNTGERTVFAVTTVPVSDKIKKSFNELLQDEAVKIEVIDNEAFAMLQRLEAAGLVSCHFPTEILYTSAAVAKTQDQQQHEKAYLHWQQAQRKQRMTQLLADGDFLEEALTVLKDAVLASLQAFSWLRNNRDYDHSISAQYIQQKWIKQHGLPSDILLLLPMLEEKSDPVAPFKKCLQAHQQVLEHIQIHLQLNGTINS